jgi:hypothetical protein
MENAETNSIKVSEDLIQNEQTATPKSKTKH